MQIIIKLSSLFTILDTNLWITDISCKYLSLVGIFYCPQFNTTKSRWIYFSTFIVTREKQQRLLFHDEQAWNSCLKFTSESDDGRSKTKVISFCEFLKRKNIPYGFISSCSFAQVQGKESVVVLIFVSCLKAKPTSPVWKCIFKFHFLKNEKKYLRGIEWPLMTSLSNDTRWQTSSHNN